MLIMSELCTGNCDGCPDVVYAIGIDESMKNMAETIEKSVVDDSFDSAVAPAIFESLKQAGIIDPEVDGVEEVASPENIAKGLRIGAAQMLDNIELARDEATKGISILTQGCLGPLTMRAAKAGRTITVTVCNSPQLPDGRAPGMVEVRRSRG